MTLISVENLIGLVLTIGIILGIRLMSSPKTAAKGNLLGALCMLAAIAITLIYNNILNVAELWIAMAIGAAIGYFMAIKVAMIQMPQMVALLNGLGGGASALVALVLMLSGSEPTMFSQFTAGLALATGGITFSGSIIAALKLDRRMKQEPVVLPNHTGLSFATLIVVFILILVFTFTGLAGAPLYLVVLANFALSLLFGLIFAIRVGGADMPITISLLNSMSGAAASIAGFAIYNPLLIAIGAVVGASGFILTQIMCRAMNRKLFEIITGSTTVAKDDKPVVTEQKAEKPIEQKETVKKEDIDKVIKEAKKIVIVPGYGMALSQAQSKVKELYEILIKQGTDVSFAIHPVAGRMPGHMNVLLAEVDIPYDKLIELEDINPEFSSTDLVIIIGANDVVNPAAKTAEGTPIYGMPILNVDEAKHLAICNFDTKPGYAGVDNPLYDGRSNVTLLLGDATETLVEILKKL